MKKHFFKKFEFEFETYRLLWYGAAGGSDFAEVASVSEKIKDGNHESWFSEWQRFAEKLEQRATTFSHTLLRGNACLRASRYYQAAEFFLDPKDPRKRAMYDKSVALFYQGLDYKNVDYRCHSIDYQGIPLRSVFFPSQQREATGTVYLLGGFDALLEELYFTNAKYFSECGYDVIIYEGPGQSHVIRDYQLPFEKDWHLVAATIKAFYQATYPLAGPTIGMGLSLGGLLLARTASLDHSLYDRVVLYNYFPSMLESFKTSMPKLVHPYAENGFPLPLEKIVSFFLTKQPYLNWQVQHAKWVIGGDSLNALLARCKDLSEEVAYRSLTTDILILAGENEHFYPASLAADFLAKIPAKNKQLILFNKEEFSTDLHCEVGSGYDANDQIIEWLATKTND